MTLYMYGAWAAAGRMRVYVLHGARWQVLAFLSLNAEVFICLVSGKCQTWKYGTATWPGKKNSLNVEMLFLVENVSVERREVSSATAELVVASRVSWSFHSLSRCPFCCSNH